MMSGRVAVCQRSEYSSRSQGRPNCRLRRRFRIQIRNRLSPECAAVETARTAFGLMHQNLQRAIGVMADKNWQSHVREARKHCLETPSVWPPELICTFGLLWRAFREPPSR